MKWNVNTPEQERQEMLFTWFYRCCIAAQLYILYLIFTTN